MSQVPTNKDAKVREFDYLSYLRSLTSLPGVYRFMDDTNRVIYVGKARNLKKRVSSYFQRSESSAKTRSMVSQIQGIEVTVTATEGAALLLESNLIKELRPRYNILLRDDKSYPYIYLSVEDPYPRLSFHRGTRRGKGRYFGPYPSAGAVRETLNLIQKLFRVRLCENSFFNNRSRPCLQYQIERCTAPCVGLIDEADYADDIQLAALFLEGKSNLLSDQLIARMEQASAKLEFEKAAHYRDQIATIKRIQERQYVSHESGDLDVLACVTQDTYTCVQVFFIRGGLLIGNKIYYPKHLAEEDVPAILAAFIAQYYLGQNNHRFIPAEILCNVQLSETKLLSDVLTEQAAHKVSIRHSVRGDRAKWISMAIENATNAVIHQIANHANILQRFEALQDALGLDTLPQRIECFDISHTQGELTVGSCVVMDVEGFKKSDYRRFNIDSITPGDDYAAMHQALDRRYSRIQAGEGVLPDVLFIDGGKGQLTQAIQVLKDLQIESVQLVGVAKGPDRKPGLETLHLPNAPAPITLVGSSAASLLIQQIRDEAHRFAITGHRQRRAKKRNSSSLEAIPGLGPKRRQLLLKQFGGLQGVARAGIDDLAAVKGIDKALASRIYDQFHND